jgi:TRAP-type mannitol/chloroaromatic compound transport system permease small subunit
MPSLTFVMPHWLYWAALLLFPALAMLLVRRQASDANAGRANYFLAYMFWAFTGFIGMHRFYVRNAWGLVFIPVFLTLLWSSAHVRDWREDVSRTRSVSEQAERLVAKAKSDVDRKRNGADERLKEATTKLSTAQSDYDSAQASLDRAESYSRYIAIFLALMLIGDAVLLHRLVRRARDSEPPAAPPVLPGAAVEDPFHQAIPLPPPSGLLGWFDLAVRTLGEFVSYWAILAVFAYYYEVVARYVFNSPTNWVHESMFLMFGMQYMLAGAYAYREDAHVRVDIVYSRLPPRGRAVCDIITSVFFFLFTLTMMVTGWRFASDAISVGERSFTEWGIQYWPVKLMIPIGAALLVLQGFSRLVRDIAFVARKVG